MKKSFIAIFSALAVSSAFADTVITALPPSGAPMPAAATVISAPTPESTKLTLAVSGVDVLAGLKKNEALDRVQQAMDSQLISAFASARKFKVLARSDWKSVLKEQDFAASGNVEPATAAKVGKALGAKYILQTTIDDFQDYIETATFATINKPPKSA